MNVMCGIFLLLALIWAIKDIKELIDIIKDMAAEIDKLNSRVKVLDHQVNHLYKIRWSDDFLKMRRKEGDGEK